MVCFSPLCSTFFINQSPRQGWAEGKGRQSHKARPCERRSPLTDVVRAVADVGRDLLHALLVQHGLLLRERAGELLVDGPARAQALGCSSRALRKQAPKEHGG